MAARDFAGIQLKMHLTGKPDPEPSGEFSMPGYGAYKTSDDRWIYLVMLTDRHWSDFWAAMGEPVDPALATLRQRKKERERVEALMRALVERWTYADISTRLAAARFGFTEVLAMDRVLDTPQARHGNKLAQLAFQDFTFDLPDLPFQTDGETATDLPPPLLGEHTAAILSSLGFSESECRAAIKSGAARVPTPGKPVWAPLRAPAA